MRLSLWLWLWLWRGGFVCVYMCVRALVPIKFIFFGGVWLRSGLVRLAPEWYKRTSPSHRLARAQFLGIRVRLSK